MTAAVPPPEGPSAPARPVVITGMHRSGTSLVAQAFSTAGVFMGHNLLPPTPSNLRGHVEQWHIVRFHDRLLEANGTTWWDQPGLASGPLATPYPWPARARAIVAQQFGNADRWGFKDPRACLFLDLWDDVLPHARYVFVIRHPAAVALSLVQRGDHLGTSGNGPEPRALTAIGLWRTYNQRILAFLDAGPGERQDASTLLLLEDLLDGTCPAQAHHLRDTFGVEVATSFDPGLLSRDIPGWLQDMARAEEANELYETLRRAARAGLRRAPRSPSRAAG